MNLTFVCTGNANRSALAEAILKKLLSQTNLTDVVVSSCGIRVTEGQKRDEIMCEIASEKGYEMGGYAIQMNEEILNSADIIIAMTAYHRNEITRLLTYSHWNRIFLFNDYCFGDISDVIDPYFQTEYIYRLCFDRIETGCIEIVKKLKNCKPVG